jgi:5-methylcytosine-specific restriction enzyme subunit McrC
MRPVITVREYARLGTGPVVPSLDAATVSQDDFDWLVQASASFKKNGAALLQVEDRRWLRLDNYVGVLEMPSGTQLEILPKHHDQEDDAQQCRDLLRRMIQVALDLTPREAGPATLELFDAPLSEWAIAQFLAHLDALVKRGLRSDYQRVEEEQRNLRGQLDVPRQMRQPPGRGHLFPVRHDVFSPDRAENRLLRTALERAAGHTTVAASWQLSHELLGLISAIPLSQDVPADFRAWRNDRLMAHYNPVRPWCELLLGNQMPVAVQGEWRGISLLFPMEKLFERFVEAGVRAQLAHGTRMLRQASSEYLCREHLGKPMFQLKPDILLTGRHGNRTILDAKWKRLGLPGTDHYGISQSDFYQLFAYGHRYLHGAGAMLLVYPKTNTFRKPLAPFRLDDRLTVWALPFDLDAGQLAIPDKCQSMF